MKHRAKTHIEPGFIFKSRGNKHLARTRPTVSHVKPSAVTVVLIDSSLWSQRVGNVLISLSFPAFPRSVIGGGWTVLTAEDISALHSEDHFVDLVREFVQHKARVSCCHVLRDSRGLRQRESETDVAS